MNNQFGLVNVWVQGDAITRFVAVLLLSMSLVSWIIIILKALDQRRWMRQAQRVEPFWISVNYDDGVTKLGQEAFNPFRALAEYGRHLNAHHHDAQLRLQDGLDASDWITRGLRGAMDEAIHRMQGGLAVLASIGSTAPFVGLFGTVWGIYHALLSIGVAGQATIDKVAGPIGEALIMTALGLAVAIPAVLGYNALVRGNKRVVAKLSRFAYDLHALFVTGARVAPMTPHGSGESQPISSKARPAPDPIQKFATKSVAASRNPDGPPALSDGDEPAPAPRARRSRASAHRPNPDEQV